MPKKESISWESLRKEYPHIPASEFLELVREIRGQIQGKSLGELEEEVVDIIKFLFAEREQEALVASRLEHKLIQDIGDKITASMFHRRLNIQVSTEIDLEHAQAFITYGFIFPSSRRVFAASNYLPLEHIRKNVSGKLLSRYSEKKFRAVEVYFLRNGVINPVSKQSKRNSEALYSLNISEQARGVTQEGKGIIVVTKQFLHDHCCSGFS